MSLKRTNMELHPIRIWLDLGLKMPKVTMLRVKLIYRLKKSKCMNMQTAVDTKVNGKVTNDMDKELSFGQVVVLTVESLRTIVEMEKVKCFMLMELNMVEPGGTMPGMVQEYLNGLKALDNTRETSEMTKCMEMEL